MTRHTFFTAMLVALLSTAAFAQAPYIITGNPTEGFTAKNGTTTVGEANQPIQRAIDAILQTNGPISIHFGDGTNVLDIGTGYTYLSYTKGEITLSGKITSAYNYCAISLGSGVSVRSGADIITTVQNTGAICNSGTLTITGGTISGISTVINNQSGTLTINDGTISGSISNNNTGTLTITGGTISAGSGVSAISNSGTATITGGTISGITNDSRYSSPSIVLGGSPNITSYITFIGDAGKLSVTESFSPGDKQYELVFSTSNGKFIVPKGAIAVYGGKKFLSNFKLNLTLSNPNHEIAPSLETNGNDIVIKLNLIYALSQSGLSFTVTKTEVGGGLFGNIIEAIDSIRIAASKGNCSIQFGDGTAELDIGTRSIEFSGTNNWGKITLLGKIIGNITISNGVSVESRADISGYISNSGTGTLTVIGGTISASGTSAISSGSGYVVLGGSPDITGRIYVDAGKLSVIAIGGDVFNPGDKQYEIALPSPSGKFTAPNGAIAVEGGKDFFSNFTLYNPGGYSVAPSLEISGNDIVLRINLIYTVSQNGLSFTITKTEGSGGQFDNITEVRNFIRITANGEDCSIQFGDGESVLDIEDLEFSGNWGKITLSGKIVGTYIRNEVYVESIADISVNSISNGGTLTITGGTISGSITNANSGILTITGGTISASDNNANAIANYNNSFFLGGSPEITGRILVFSGTVSVITEGANTFTPAEKQYRLFRYPSPPSPGDVVVVGGADYVDNFTLAVLSSAANYGLTPNGNDLVTACTVTFLDWDNMYNTVLKIQFVKSGSAATAPEAPVREGYKFTGWNVDFSNVTSNLSVRAQYITLQTVIFFDWDRTTVLKTEIVEDRSAAIAPEDPVREGYTFTGWDYGISYGNAVAKYDINTYTVTFLDWNDTVLTTNIVAYGSPAEFYRIDPTRPNHAFVIDPTREGYTFVGWDKALDYITGDLTVTALYEEDITPILSPKIATGSLLMPTQNGITLTAKTNATIAVYNLSGKLISRQNYNAGSHSISLGHLPKGMYVVKASHGSENEVLRMAVR